MYDTQTGQSDVSCLVLLKCLLSLSGSGVIIETDTQPASFKTFVHGFSDQGFIINIFLFVSDMCVSYFWRVCGLTSVTKTNRLHAKWPPGCVGRTNRGLVLLFKTFLMNYCETILTNFLTPCFYLLPSFPLFVLHWVLHPLPPSLNSYASILFFLSFNTFLFYTLVVCVFYFQL